MSIFFQYMEKITEKLRIYMRREYMKEKILKALIGILIISTIITGYYAFRLRER